MSNRVRVTVAGAGSWGTAVANIIADNGHPVTLWGRDSGVMEEITREHENKKYLRGIKLSPNLNGTADLKKALTDSEIIVCSIPTQHIRKVFSAHAILCDSKLVVNTSKGIEMGTLQRVSEIIQSIAPTAHYAILSGPSFAHEVAQRLPSAVTVASKDVEKAEVVQRLMSNGYFRAYTSEDVAGVELAGALKNVVAIATGMVVGLKLGYNAQAAIINRGIAEIMRMGRHFGAEPITFLGLAGTGDLILTCTGPLSRNRRVGIALGEGKKIDEIERDLGGVAEGVSTAKSAHELAERLKIDMPITEQVYKIIYENSTPQKALIELMSRDLKAEW